jgi:hypothetical protein
VGVSYLGIILGTVLLALSGQTGPVSLTAEIGSTLVVPIGDEAFGHSGAGFAGSATMADPQRGQIVYSLSGGRLTMPVDLVTQATFLVPVSPSSPLFDDPVNARLYRGKVVSLVRIPANRGLAPGEEYQLRARVVRGESVTPLEYSASLMLNAPSPGRRPAPSAAWDFLSSWLPAKAAPTSAAGFDLSLAVPRPALQLQWSWSGGPEIRGTPPELDDGGNKILGVELVVHYPPRVIDVVRVVAPAGRELAIWSQDDGNGELAIQAVSRDGLSLDHLEVAFDLDGARPLDPADPIDGVRVDFKQAIDEHGYPADRGRTPPWSLAVADVTVR